MRSTFVFSLCLTLIFSLSYWYSATAHICPVPLSYRVGELDERFLLDKAELEAILAAATAVWESRTGRDLFVLDDTASLTVNLVFDERQQLARTEEEWRLRLDAEQARYETELAEIRQLQAEYERERARYDSDQENFNALLATYNAEVEAFNRSGGAPPEEFARLEATAAALRTMSAKLTEAEDRLNRLVADIKTQGEATNALIVSYNAEVEAYNALFGQRQTITQGEFRRDTITVFKFSERDELKRVLAHELGHALGIGHVEGEESVMYYLITEASAPPVLSDADLAAFVAVCGEADTLPAQVRRTIRTLLNNFN